MFKKLSESECVGLMTNTRNVIGIIPAAGYAHRIAPLPCSKEIYPIGHPDGIRRAVSSYLLDSFAHASVQQTYFIIREGKWDIPAYFKDGSAFDNDIAYIVTGATPGVPYTVDRTFPFVKDRIVLLGFPDIIIQPVDTFTTLLNEQATSQADLVLGLFTAENPEKMDMIAFDKAGEINDIIIKPTQTELTKTWLAAAWTPVFTMFLHTYLARHQQLHPSGELHMGNVFCDAIRSGLKTSYVHVEKGRYLDIGTPEDLEKARHIAWLK